MDKPNHNPQYKRQNKDTKDFAKRLYQLLKTPMSRRMAATKMGFDDQTYMVCPYVDEWLKFGRAQVVGVIKCERSNKLVQKVTTNEELFEKKDENQLGLFKD